MKKDNLAESRYCGSKTLLEKATEAFDAADYRGALELRYGYLLIAALDQFRLDVSAYLEHIEWKLTQGTEPPVEEESVA